MPAIQLFITQDDLPRIEDWLDQDAHIAQIVSVGAGQWKAKYAVELSMPGRWSLFHDMCGPLPLLAPKSGGEDADIADPFSGWTEQRLGADPSVPYFGAGHTGIFRLGIRPEREGVSHLTMQWVGNHYSGLGQVATDEAKTWWGRLRRFMLKDCERVDQNIKLTSSTYPYWATPRAIAARS